MILNEMTQNKTAIVGAHWTSTTEFDLPGALLLRMGKYKPAFKICVSMELEV